MPQGSVWKQKQISPSSNISLAGDVLTWLESEIANLQISTNGFVCVMRDNVDISTWSQDEFVGAMFNKDQTGTKSYYRCRGMVSIYLQNRSFPNDETATVYANETYTIFYQ